jgi:hypothetical protein
MKWYAQMTQAKAWAILHGPSAAESLRRLRFMTRQLRPEELDSVRDNAEGRQNPYHSANKRRDPVSIYIINEAAANEENRCCGRLLRVSRFVARIAL